LNQTGPVARSLSGITENQLKYQPAEIWRDINVYPANIDVVDGHDHKDYGCPPVGHAGISLPATWVIAVRHPGKH
jgi:hypothetical protein